MELNPDQCQSILVHTLSGWIFKGKAVFTTKQSLNKTALETLQDIDGKSHFLVVFVSSCSVLCTLRNMHCIGIFHFVEILLSTVRCITYVLCSQNTWRESVYHHCNFVLSLVWVVIIINICKISHHYLPMLEYQHRQITFHQRLGEGGENTWVSSDGSF